MSTQPNSLISACTRDQVGHLKLRTFVRLRDLQPPHRQRELNRSSILTDDRGRVLRIENRLPFRTIPLNHLRCVANVSYITLGATLGLDGRRELLRRFQVMHRDRTEFAYASFWDLFYESVRRHKLIEEADGRWPTLRPMAYSVRSLVSRKLEDLSQSRTQEHIVAETRKCMFLITEAAKAHQSAHSQFRRWR